MLINNIPVNKPINISYLLLLLSSLVFSQEILNINKQDLSKGIQLTYKGNQLSSDTKYLTLLESNSYILGISKVMLDQKDIWLKRSDASVSQNGVIHWFDDKSSGRLILDLKGIRSQIHSKSILAVVTALHTIDKQYFSITSYQSHKPPGTQMNHLTKIKETNIHVK